ATRWRRTATCSSARRAGSRTSSPSHSRAEWLEADGLGGFASGTAIGIRTRRYHALLLAATAPPTGRVVLVNGLEAWVERPDGAVALSSQRYAPDVVHPDGAERIESFAAEPWPRWTFRLPDGSLIEHGLLVAPGRAATALYWRLHEGRGGTLAVRPLVSGRDYHALHHENPAFRFDAEVADGRVVWRPYPGLPAIVARANGAYAHQPDWYRNFLYTEERDRGLDCVEDLASPGIFRWDLARGEAPEFNAVDAALWYVVAVHDFLEAAPQVPPRDRQTLAGAVEAILAGYVAGTRYRIHVDGDGLLAAGEPGVQLTWMDAKVGDWVVTPRIGKPVEVQALWLNALRIGSELSERWAELYARARPAFAARFRGGTPAARAEARARFLDPLLAHLSDAGLGHLPEIADGDPPHTPRGCPFQAWSVGEALRLTRLLA